MNNKYIQKLVCNKKWHEGKHLEALMEEAYLIYEDFSSIKYETFLDLVNCVYGQWGKALVMFGNLNYQVENGGFFQWHENGYSLIDEDDLDNYGYSSYSPLKAISDIRFLLSKFMKDDEEASEIIRILRAVNKIDWRESEYENQRKDDDLDELDTDFYKVNNSVLEKLNLLVPEILEITPAKEKILQNLEV